MVRLVLLRLLESYFRHRWLYLLPIVLMSGAAFVYISFMPATYAVSGTLYVQDGNLLSSLTAIRSDGFSYVTPAQATASELYQLLNAKAFLRAIIEKTDMEAKMAQDQETVDKTITEARDAIWLQELGNNLVKVAVQHEMPRIAQQLADATIETYIQWKINLNREESVAAQTFFVDLAKTYRAAVEPARQALDNYLKTHPKPIQGDRPDEETATVKQLQTALDTAEERLQRAENQEESARLALIQAESTVRQSYFVVDAPTRPLTPEHSAKELLVTLAIFVAAGFFLSFIGIVGGALLDDSMRFPIDVLHGLDLPVLTMIPEARVEVTHAQFRVNAIVGANQSFNAAMVEQVRPRRTADSRAVQPNIGSYTVDDFKVLERDASKHGAQHLNGSGYETSLVGQTRKRKSIFG